MSSSGRAENPAATNHVQCRHADTELPGGVPSRWLFLKSGPGSAAFNMALDEALLELSSAIASPVLRFYSWREPAASFGYFQRVHDVEQLTPLRPLVRRPTGGGIVPHDTDWTYSLVFPTFHAWYQLAAKDSYRMAHQWIQAAFERLEVATELAPEGLKTHAGQCFVGHEQSDLLWRGRKVAGAAQRRRKDGLLIQGSVQPPLSSLDRVRWESSMLEVGRQFYGALWEADPADSRLLARAEDLAQTKYGQAAYNRQR